MSSCNSKVVTKAPRTHEGGIASRINNFEKLKRSVLSSMLWENSFYEDGMSVADRISSLIPNVKAEDVAKLAIDARSKYNLRHMPLFLAREMVKHKTHKHFVSDVLYNVIQRPDELAEFLAVYWKDGKQPIANQVKKGLGKAFTKFGEYQLAKYNRDKEIKLRDVMFLCHPTPEGLEQEFLWKKLVGNYCVNCGKPNFAHKGYKDTPKKYSGPLDGCSNYVEAKLDIPYTWEVELSKDGSNKCEVFTNLIKANKLGAMATLRNLRGMLEAKVDINLLKDYIRNMKTERILPFRFITAAKYAPQLEDVLEEAMFKCLEGYKKLKGKTVLLVDVSGSMGASISNKSEMTRFDAANSIAILAREICEDVSIYTFSNKVVSIPPRRGFALRDSIMSSQPNSCTYLGRALSTINKNESYDRILIYTDEQSHDNVGSHNGRGYIFNVASYENGVNYKDFIHINGFSSNSLDWLLEYEKEFC
ncbi:MAG: TROVE domain-containing protein [Tenuifilaceae bacterium]|nr:TROVE domain-containing protein [Tenuifilaceae bacterium]